MSSNKNIMRNKKKKIQAGNETQKMNKNTKE